MEGARKPDTGESSAELRQSIVAAWRQLGGGGVGRRELVGIQRSLGTKASGPSPAAIARVLADHGAELKHPEIIECDAEWRRAFLEKEAQRLEETAGPDQAKPLRLNQAESLIIKLEKQRLGFERAGDRTAAGEIQTLAIETRQTALLRAKDKSQPQSVRREQNEIA